MSTQVDLRTHEERLNRVRPQDCAAARVSGLYAGPVWVVRDDYRTGYWLGGDILLDDDLDTAWWSGYWLDAAPVDDVG